MITFAYHARDAAGKTISGIQDAFNEENAINTLMSRGLLVLSIQQKAGAKARTSTKVSDSDLVLFTRQLATMVDAGLPLVSGLTALHEQADPKKQAGLRNVIGQITANIEQGESFNESLAKHPQVFGRLYVSMVKAGESGGLLADILDRLSGFLEASARLAKKVKAALTYPIVVLCIAFLITSFLVLKIVPIFGSIYANFGKALPAPTQILLDISSFVRGIGGVVLLVVLVGGFFGVRAYIKTKAGAERWDRLRLKLPVCGPLIHKISMTRFARTFAQLIRSGVPILETIDIVRETAGNVVLADAIGTMSTGVEKGEHLSACMESQPIFPRMLVRMVAAGESTGKMDTMLDKMADFWDEEVEATLDALTSLIEPILMCFLGVIIGGIVISLYLPIFKLGQVVSS